MPSSLVGLEHLLEGDTQPRVRTFRETPDEYWSEKLGRPFTPREALRLEGTESTRDIIAFDFWVWSVEMKIKNQLSKNSNSHFVISDVRFPNEISWIKSMGGTTVRIIRGEEPDWWDAAVEWNAQSQKDQGTLSYTETQIIRDLEKVLKTIHPSEKAWIGTKFDRTIYNDLGFGELTKEVSQMLLSIDNLMKT